MVAWLAARTSEPNRIRAFDPGRDLSDLASLIEVAFGPELAATGSHMVQDMRQMALWGPAARAFGWLAPLFSGFVWIEDSQLIANVSLCREPTPNNWSISNVAVLPEYRGRGIATRLVETAIAHIVHRRGRRILLQVRIDSAPAQSLYRHYGFTTFDTRHDLQRTSQRRVVDLGRAPQRVRAVRFRDLKHLHNLVVSSTSSAVLRYRPIPRNRYRTGLVPQLAQSVQMAVSGQQLVETVGERNDHPVAYARLKLRAFRGSHELEMHVLPSERGKWEYGLVSAALDALGRYPRPTVRASVSVTHPDAIASLHAQGFETLRVLDQMAVDLP